MSVWSLSEKKYIKERLSVVLYCRRTCGLGEWLTARLPQVELPAVALCLSAVVLLVILLCTDVPEVLAQGFAATRLLLLIPEVLDVSDNLREVSAASIDSTGYCRKTVTNQDLVGSNRSGALWCFAQKQSVAIFVGGRSCAVCCQQHFLARMLTVLARFTQRT